jgi:hypothetical protein
LKYSHHWLLYAFEPANLNTVTKHALPAR